MGSEEDRGTIRNRHDAQKMEAASGFEPLHRGKKPKNTE